MLQLHFGCVSATFCCRHLVSQHSASPDSTTDSALQGTPALMMDHHQHVNIPESTQESFMAVHYISVVEASEEEHPPYYDTLSTTTAWPYQYGTQIGPTVPTLKPNSELSKVLNKNAMIELTTFDPVKKKYTAMCHSCSKLFNSTTAQSLFRHVASNEHANKLMLPSHSLVPADEQLRRNRLSANPKFAPFIQWEGDTLFCKFCVRVLSADSAKLNTHANTRLHLEKCAEVNNEDFKIDLNEPNRLRVLQSLVKRFPDFGLVTQKLLHQNEVFQYNIPKEERHLKLNDLYCKVCFRKIVRCDIRYLDSIKDHLKSKAHKKNLLKLNQSGQSDLLPPRPITTRVKMT